MTNQEDYQLESMDTMESMEDAAVAKTQTAKRVLAGVGLAAAGATTAYAATGLSGESTEENALTAEDLLNGAQESTITEEVIEEETPKASSPQASQPAPAPQPEPIAETEPESQIDVNKTTIYINEDGSTSIIDEGHYDNRDFAVVDLDADGHGDILFYDVNGNGTYEDNEMAVLDHGDYIMGQGREMAVVEHESIIDPYEPEPYVIEDDINVNPNDNRYVAEKEDIQDIENDFDKHTGDNYGKDLAHYSDDYNNNGDIEHYAAGHDNAYYDNNYGQDEMAYASAEVAVVEEYTEEYDLAKAGDAPVDYDAAYGDSGYSDELANYDSPADDYVEPDYGNDLAYDGSADNMDLI